MASVRDLMTILDQLAAPTLAESWDNVGLMVGEPGHEISGILVALDPTPGVLAEAKHRGCNTIVTHHPLIFKGLRSIRTDRPEGKILSLALLDRLAIIGCHTNLDKAAGGVNDMLATRLGLLDCRSILPEPDGAGTGPIGFGRIGSLPATLGFDDFISHLRRNLDLQVIKVAGPPPPEIRKVAVCGGSGSELAPLALAEGAQIFVSSEIKHDVARWAESAGFCVADCGHFATENVMVAGLTALIRHGCSEQGLAVEVLATESQSNPFRYY